MPRVRAYAQIGALFVAAAIIPMPTVSYGSCSQSAANVSDADQQWWNMHKCQSAYFLWQYKAYDLNGNDWAGQGWDNACNPVYNYPKFWSASYLINYGLADNYNSSFHFSQSDYRPLAEAASGSFHDSQQYFPPDPDLVCCYGQFTYDPFGANNIDLGCLLFDKTLSKVNANPASRAGDFMHESWHDWQNKYDVDGGNCGGHICGPLLGCTAKGCDFFYFHKISTFGPGQLYKFAASGPHSPNQIQVEFLCDVAQLPASNVPKAVLVAAKADADDRSLKRFINGPGYKCGQPRPW